jgi:hypothetical protein
MPCSLSEERTSSADAFLVQLHHQAGFVVYLGAPR